uniref:MBD domain-containing protein n=1 Tax=Gongylonema pulchrum TaxID=637853 RepID=A0A183D2Y6_9BILA
LLLLYVTPIFLHVPVLRFYSWRRETCIRTISASGVRGDVIYYAPCGKRLGSYAEVMRYLNKRNITNIDREHFSFSCKIIVGDYIQIRIAEDGKRILYKITEEEVLAQIARCSTSGSRKSSSVAAAAAAKMAPSPVDLSKTDPTAATDKKALHHLQRRLQRNEQYYAQLLFGLFVMNIFTYIQLEQAIFATPPRGGTPVVAARGGASRHSTPAVAEEKPPKPELSEEEKQEERLRALRLPTDDLLIEEARVNSCPPLLFCAFYFTIGGEASGRWVKCRSWEDERRKIGSSGEYHT